MPIFLRAPRSCLRLSFVRSTPLMTTSPDVGRSSRLMQRTSVDLPAPEKPMMPKTSPSSIVRLTSRTADTSPWEVLNVLFRFTSSIKACSVLF